MNMCQTHYPRRLSSLAFTLVELLVATSIGSMVAGGVVILLCQTSIEQRNGFADMTVEERAYILQSDLATCLRCMSANQGLTPNYSTGVYDGGGNLLGYQSVYVFYPTNSAYLQGNITYVPSTGSVIYTPDCSSPYNTVTWMSNSATAVLTNMYFSTSLNLDGSQNSSLVNVSFQMNDNGFSRQSPVNNPTSIYRNFAMQMRNDN
jgi:type II secretory pathway pseudopilin PulG